MMQEERRICICVAALAILLSPAKPSCGQSAAWDKKTQDHTQANSQTSTLETEPALDGYCPAAFLLEGKGLNWQGWPMLKTPSMKPTLPI